MITLKRNQISPLQFNWRNNPEIYRYTRQNGLISPEAHEQWLQSIKYSTSILMFGAVNALGITVGTVGFTSYRPEHGSAEFSCFIGPEYQKQGYGRKALIELFKYGFHYLRLNRIYGETLESNPALKLFKDLGMKEEGVLRGAYFKNGHYENAIVISILEGEAKDAEWWKI